MTKSIESSQIPLWQVGKENNTKTYADIIDSYKIFYLKISKMKFRLYDKIEVNSVVSGS